MAYPVIIRSHFGMHSYLVLDEKPREYLRHVGFQEEFEIRLWLGSHDPCDAMEEWAEMLGEDSSLGDYLISDSDNWTYQSDIGQWKNCRCPD